MRMQRNNQNQFNSAKVALAWEKFTGTGLLPTESVRQVIGKSWVKSKELGISPDTERAPTVITSSEVAEMQKTADLIQASRQVLGNLDSALKDTQHVIVIADADSRILYSVGHKPIQDKLENINFRPGADWSERLVGPNGVGTPLKLAKPEMVMGYEHYCRAWQPWVCYGAPVFDASGQYIKGVVDITGPAEKVSKETMAMTITLAQSISANLAVAQFRQREQLRERGKALLEKWCTDAVLIVDEYATIVDYNTKATLMLNRYGNDLLNQSISAFLPDIQGNVSSVLQSGTNCSVEIHDLQHAASGSDSLQINLEPIVIDAKCCGIAVVLNASNQLSGMSFSKLPAVSENNLHALNDELIRQTLIQTNYNISKAARVLGIDRTTIYRRMRKWSQ